MNTTKHFVLRSTLILFLASILSSAPFIQVRAESYGTTENVCVASDGSLPNNQCYSPSIVSPDGRYVYFASIASNLVPNDTNNATDIFVHDRETGSTTMLDVNSSGTEANLGVSSTNFSISDGGRYLAFDSTSTNLVSSEYNSNNALFVRDLKTGVTTLIYQNHTTGQGVGSEQISGNGDWIVFQTMQPQTPYSDTTPQTYLVNRNTLALTRVSNGTGGTNSNNFTEYPQINYDGNAVIFTSPATNLTSSGTNRHQHVYLWNRTSNSTTEVDVNSSGVQGNADSISAASISGDGNKIVFDSSATNLVSPSTTHENAFLRKVDSGSTTLLSTNSSGTEGNASSGEPKISEDGHDVVFISDATDLVPNDTFSDWSTFVKNTDDNTTTQINYDLNGALTTEKGYPYISSDGQYVIFNAVLSNGSTGIYLRS